MRLRRSIVAQERIHNCISGKDCCRGTSLRISMKLEISLSLSLSGRSLSLGFFCSSAASGSVYTSVTAGRMQAEKHRSALARRLRSTAFSAAVGNKMHRERPQEPGSPRGAAEGISHRSPSLRKHAIGLNHRPYMRITVKPTRGRDFRRHSRRQRREHKR